MAVASQRIYFVSLGCPKNQVDTELMLGQVEAAGHSLVDAPEAADVIVVNTCAFIDAAKEESVDTILEMAEYKKAEQGQARRHRLSRAALLRRARQGHPRDRSHPRLVGLPVDLEGARRRRAAARSCRSSRSPTTPEYIYDHEAPRVRIGATHTAYVKIAEGCDRPCSFCIIPKLRGPQRSRTIADIVAEVAQLGRERRARGQPDRAGPHALRLGCRQLAATRARRSRSCCARSARSTASIGSGSTTRSRARSTTI